MATDTLAAPDIQPGFPGSAPLAPNPAQPAMPGTPYAPVSGAGTDELPETPGVDVDQQAMGFLSYLKQEQAEMKKRQAARSAPGSFADRLKSAVGQLDASFGDTADAAKGLVPGESGAGHGVAATMAARTKRLQGEREEARRDQEFQQRSAMNNIEMATHVQQLLSENEKMQNVVFDSNKASVKAREDAGWHVEHDVSEADAKDRISKTLPDGRHYTDAYDFVPVGFNTVNGKKTPKYDVISKQDTFTDVDDATADLIKKNGGPDLTGAKQVPYVSLRALQLEAQRKAANKVGIEESLGKELSSEQFMAMNKALATRNVQDALRVVPGDRIASLMQSLDMLDGGIGTADLKGEADTLDLGDAHGGIRQHEILLQQAQSALAQAQKSNNPQAVQQGQAAVQEAQQWLDKHKKAAEDIRTVLTALNMDKDAIKQHEEYVKEKEKEAHDIATEDIAKDKAEALTKAKAAKDPETFATSPAADKIYEGLYSLQLDPAKDMGSMRNDTRLALVSHMMEKYPLWNEGAYKQSWKTVDDFTNGKVGQNLNNFSTAIEHLNQASQAYQLMAKGDVGIQAANKLFRKIGYQVFDDNPQATLKAVREALVGELARAYTGVGATVDETNSLKQNLDEGLQKGNAQKSISATMATLKSRENSLRNNFNNGITAKWLPDEKRQPEAWGIKLLSPEAAQIFRDWGYGGQPGNAPKANNFSVKANGKTITFKTQEALDSFKKDAQAAGVSLE